MRHAEDGPCSCQPMEGGEEGSVGGVGGGEEDGVSNTGIPSIPPHHYSTVSSLKLHAVIDKQ